jgi:AcrR family transcriptional regulator
VNVQSGLRERKKQQTRVAIAQAARELFAERGYHATTLPDIAAAADVSTRTIFAYFPSKEDILFSEFEEMKAALARALADRPDGKDALETMREFIVSSRHAEKSELDERLHRCVESDETLRSHLRARIAQLEEVIAPEIAKDLGAPEDDIRPQIVAASLTAAFNLMLERDSGLKDKPSTPEEVGSHIDPVIAFLRGGLAALKGS